MAKTKEELQELKAKVEALSAELGQLSEEELTEVTGGIGGTGAPDCLKVQRPSAVPKIISGAGLINPVEGKNRITPDPSVNEILKELGASGNLTNAKPH